MKTLKIIIGSLLKSFVQTISACGIIIGFSACVFKVGQTTTLWAPGILFLFAVVLILVGVILYAIHKQFDKLFARWGLYE